MSSSAYLLADQVSELERLRLQSLVWEPSGRRLLDEIGDGRGLRAVDIGCGVMGWLRLLSEWVGADGEVVGTDIDDAMLTSATQFVTEESLENVVLVNDDLFATRGSPRRSTWCTPGSSSPRWAVATNSCKPTSGCSAPAAPSSWRTLTEDRGTSTRQRKRARS